jgi:hypothetical protein
MKKCLFFFVAFVLAVALAALTETPAVKEVEDQVVVSYDERAEETSEIPAHWPADEPDETYVSQSKTP